MIKPLEENISQTLSDINHSNIFSDPPPRVMTMKTKINKWDLIKLKSFCTAKETLYKTKRQPTEWEKIFANEVTDKGLISEIYKQLLQLNTKKNPTPSKKWAEGVPVVAQWLTNPTRNHEVAGSVPALAQWVDNPALP